VLTDVDSTVACLGSPGEEERFAHPAGGDVCTSLSITPPLWHSLAGQDARPRRSGGYVDARLELVHRRVLVAARNGDPTSPWSSNCSTTLPADAAAAAGRAAVVERAREAIAADHPAAGTLLSLAELLGVSPYRLSRAFTHDFGVSLTHYRNRVRVGRALERLARRRGEPAVLVADLGFADQAHITRTMRAHLGHPPTAVRRLLHTQARR
jgi:AraC-like DNA-binding protein